MDLTEESGYQLSHERNLITGITTITIKDATGTTVLGEITVEHYKVRAFLDSLAEIGKNFYPDTIIDDNWRRRTTLFINEGIAITEFSVT